MSKTVTTRVIADEKTERSGINALRSFDAIMTVVDQHRPFEPSDFVKEYYIPDI
jgi:hypothetical protein